MGEAGTTVDCLMGVKVEECTGTKMLMSKNVQEALEAEVAVEVLDGSKSHSEERLDRADSWKRMSFRLTAVVQVGVEAAEMKRSNFANISLTVSLSSAF